MAKLPRRVWRPGCATPRDDDLCIKPPTFRLTEEDRAMIDAAVFQSGLTPAEWYRRAVTERAKSELGLG